MASKAIFFAATVLVAGCASPTYNSPVSGPLAKVRFAAASGTGVTVLEQYDDEDCKQNEVEVARLRAGDLLKTNSQKIGIPLNTYHPNASHEIVIQAEKTFYGVFRGGENLGISSYVCKAPFAFTPATDTYEVLFQSNLRGCRVMVSRITRNGGG
jgi:hypothetical protein